MINSLRDYIALLDELGWIDHITDEVELLQIPTIMKEQEQKRRTVLFEHVKGCRSPLINNLFPSRDYLGRLFSCEGRDVTRVFAERYEASIPPVLVDSGPVQEVVLGKGEFDIRDFPFIQHNAGDAGRYITAGMVIAKDPVTGVRNLSFNRMQLKGPDRTGFRMSPTQDLENYYNKAKKLGRNLEIAVVIGNSTYELLAAACGPARDVDELGIAGALRGAPVELVKCKTVDLEVPANAELVLEGYLVPGEMEPEGPFGDFMEFKIQVMDNPILHIQTVTMRKDPIVQCIGAGSKDDGTLLSTPREAQIYNVLKAANADVTAINLNLVNNYLTGVAAIRKQLEYEPKNLIMAAFGSFKFLKNFIIVDHDVDIFDPKDVFWALSTRLRAEQGVMVVPHTVGFGRDDHGIHTAKLGIDATAPLNCWDEFARVQPPAWPPES